ncbi:formate/nitrite transporter family protein [Cryobacterium sp. TMT1-21]|uniref:Formate/nitrite transporter family protein n=1 Tax=Cryobacterium shii TaxID=1259235 RepID=A0AAQ2C8Q3_9MICO|nr:MULTISPECIES: formate/nitrite transporter family protein [Cryobacterium]TFC52359.1 formate/nitrite transporter family protein [Cryobacterium shii]TFC87525.1 formate/nitrite transporter family protein [Cryobacterium sp. TmT2-59]TFD10873.1 formate/nitrite transporter family protein [Cryobacterium sp. TMT1-21]TFD16520.1 formate/nitrite transporter family protein [Cryobacterium sp. TMT2-23]TFD20488.1 formate/nitrite transporter family protein [Cryobacterium sp. TMT4-10]
MSYVKPDQLIDDIIHSGEHKSNLTTKQMFVRGTLSGAILGAATTVALTAAAQTGLPIVGAVLFPVGFAIILLLGLELVTGSFALIPLAVLEGRTTIRKCVKNFVVVILAHLLGAGLYAALYTFAITYAGTDSSDPMVQAIIHLAEHKVLPYQAAGAGGILVAIVKAMLCNWMVAIGTIMFYTSKSTGGKILAMWLPVTIFFSLGLEHAIVNMFVIPAGMMLGADISMGEWWLWNQAPVLLGNLLGAIAFTALPVYFSHRTRGNRAVTLDAASASPVLVRS